MTRMTPSDISKTLLSGMKATLDMATDFSDDPETEIRPEYLKTIAVAQALKGALTRSTSLVRLEHRTNDVLGRSVQMKDRVSGFWNSICRPGEIDIVVSQVSNGWRFPVVIVENKLFAKGFSTIEADVDRCLEFLRAQGTAGSIEVAAVTYYRRQVDGLTIAHQNTAATAALDSIKKAVAARVVGTGITHRHDRMMLRTSAFNTMAEATDLDEEGTPAYISQPSVTVWAAVELFSRPATTSRLGAL
jgi:hypothetical protein